MPAKTAHQIKLIKKITHLKTAIEAGDTTLQLELKKLENDLKSSLGSVGQKKKQQKPKPVQVNHACRDAVTGEWKLCEVCQGRVHKHGCKTIKKEWDCCKKRHTKMGLEWVGKSDADYYERKTKITLEEGFDFINSLEATAEIDGVVCSIKSGGVRLPTFVKHGTTCVTCKLPASFFAVERRGGQTTRYHLNLYGVNDKGMDVLFTHDHILARSAGGLDTLENTQTMCSPCNSHKSTYEPRNTKRQAAKEIAKLTQKLYDGNHAAAITGEIYREIRIGASHESSEVFDYSVKEQHAS
jgi:hypothetical protein